MKSIFAFLAFTLFSTSAIAVLPAGHPPADSAPNAAAIPMTLKGKAINVIAVEQYTYIEVSQGKNTLWLATTKTPIKKGDMIQFEDGMVMTNFYSKSLKRTFPSIKFVGKVMVINGKK